MPVTGYILVSGQGGWPSEHNPQHYCFYISATNKWCMVADDGSVNDFFLWEWNGTFPSAGTAGGWAKASLSAGGNVNVDTRDTALPDLWWDEATLTLHQHSWHATPQYHRWTYNTANGLWTEAVTAQSTGVAGTMPSGGFTVDSNGVVWVVFYGASAILSTRFRSGTVWSAGPILETVSVVTLNDSRVAVTTATISGAVAVCCGYSYSDSASGGVGKWKFQYRLDSLSSQTAWTSETVDTTTGIDDHATIASLLEDGQSNSTILLVGKDAGNDILSWRRSPAGSWSSVVQVVTVITRPRLVIDATNSNAYVFVTGSGANDDLIVYFTSPVSTLSWSASAVAIDNGTGTGDLNDALVPNHAVNSTSGLMMGCTQTSIGVWWNKVTIPGAAGSAAGGGIRDTLGMLGFANVVRQVGS